MIRMRLPALVLATGMAALLLDVAGLAAVTPAAARDQDWPCQQRLVPELSAGSVWNGPALPPAGAWRQDPAIVSLVAAAAPRTVSAEAGLALVTGFADALPGERRVAALPLAFSGLLEATNEARAEVIARIRELARRQREIAALVDRISTEQHALPALPEGSTDAAHEEVAERRAYVIRQFEETQRTMRYACEVPVQLEARLGRYAQALLARLPAGP